MDKLTRHALSDWTTMVAFLTIGFLLGGCQTQASRAEQQALLDQQDRQNCQEMGFTPDTDAFGNCVLKLKELRAEQQVLQGPNIGFGIGIGVGL